MRLTASRPSLRPRQELSTSQRSKTSPLATHQSQRKCANHHSGHPVFGGVPAVASTPHNLGRLPEMRRADATNCLEHLQACRPPSSVPQNAPLRTPLLAYDRCIVVPPRLHMLDNTDDACDARVCPRRGRRRARAREHGVRPRHPAVTAQALRTEPPTQQPTHMEDTAPTARSGAHKATADDDGLTPTPPRKDAAPCTQPPRPTPPEKIAAPRTQPPRPSPAEGIAAPRAQPRPTPPERIAAPRTQPPRPTPFEKDAAPCKQPPRPAPPERIAAPRTQPSRSTPPKKDAAPRAQPPHPTPPEMEVAARTQPPRSAPPEKIAATRVTCSGPCGATGYGSHTPPLRGATICATHMYQLRNAHICAMPTYVPLARAL